jgi:hypothetical protein
MQHLHIRVSQLQAEVERWQDRATKAEAAVVDLSLQVAQLKQQTPEALADAVAAALVKDATSVDDALDEANDFHELLADKLTALLQPLFDQDEDKEEARH